MLEGTVIEEFETYATIRVDNGDGSHSRWLPVVCPRKDCGEEFLVRLNWKKMRRYHNKSTGVTTVFTTRSCPYCFKVSQIPRIYWTEVMKEKYDKANEKFHQYFKTTFRTPSDVRKGR